MVPQAWLDCKPEMLAVYVELFATHQEQVELGLAQPLPASLPKRVFLTGKRFSPLGKATDFGKGEWVTVDPVTGYWIRTLPAGRRTKSGMITSKANQPADKGHPWRRCPKCDARLHRYEFEDENCDGIVEYLCPACEMSEVAA
jgi:hypothetical protein